MQCASIVYLLCTALWWQIERRGGPFSYLSMSLQNKAKNSTESLIQCDQIGQFFKVLGDTFSHKVAQIYGGFLGYFENITDQEEVM